MLGLEQPRRDGLLVSRPRSPLYIRMGLKSGFLAPEKPGRALVCSGKFSTEPLGWMEEDRASKSNAPDISGLVSGAAELGILWKLPIGN